MSTKHACSKISRLGVRSQVLTQVNLGKVWLSKFIRTGKRPHWLRPSQIAFVKPCLRLLLPPLGLPQHRSGSCATLRLRPAQAVGRRKALHLPRVCNPLLHHHIPLPPPTSHCSRFCAPGLSRLSGTVGKVGSQERRVPFLMPQSGTNPLGKPVSFCKYVWVVWKGGKETAAGDWAVVGKERRSGRQDTGFNT